MPLKSNPLLHTHLYVGGEWVEKKDTFSVINPGTGAHLAQVSRASPQDAERALEKARQSFPLWRGRPPSERGTLLRSWSQRLLDHKEALALLITQEQGKPLRESKKEVVSSSESILWAAEEAERLLGHTPFHEKQAYVLREPIGVCAAITPWNFPASSVARRVSVALAAGCPIVLKPSEHTPLTALAFAHLAPFPPGVLSVLPCAGSDREALGRTLSTHPFLRKLAFTGSTAAGKTLLAQAASTVKRVSLELGGNAPFIVCKDADLDHAVRGLMSVKFRNAGQTCVSANRIFVHTSLFDGFVDKMRASMDKLNVGYGEDQGVHMGPLIHQAAFKRVEAFVQAAQKEGMNRLHVSPVSLPPPYYPPTLMVGYVPHLLQQEIFGPVAVLSPFHTEKDVILMANDTSYGLSAYVYTQDKERGEKIAQELECGMVGINTHTVSSNTLPFGGVKESGLGYRGSSYGLEEWFTLKTIRHGLTPGETS